MSDLSAGAVRVRVPATSANLGPGFDALGLALALHDEVVAQIIPAGLQIEVTGTGSDFVPRDERHLVVRAMRAAFEEVGGQPSGLRLHCRNAVPHSRGLGSSAAAIVAGVRAATALLDAGLPAAEELALCARIEGHPDNVAACLLGGLSTAWYDGDRARAVRLEPAPGVHPVLAVPQERSSTAQARGMLPPDLPHGDAAFTVGRAALLVAALTRRPDLLLPATDDRLHQPFRRSAQPASAELVDRLRDSGIPAAVSGAGPAVIAFTDDAGAVVGLAGEGFEVRPLPVDLVGASCERVDVG